jgi:hypothetical protein
MRICALVLLMADEQTSSQTVPGLIGNRLLLSLVVSGAVKADDCGHGLNASG